MMAPAGLLLNYIQSISKEAPSCTLVTSLGERVEVMFFLLADFFLISNVCPGAIPLAGCNQPVFGISPLPGRFSLHPLF